MKKISLKLFSVTILILLSYMLVGILLNVFFLKSYYIYQNKEKFETIAEKIEVSMASNNIDTLIADIAHDEGMYIAITDSRFKTISTSNNSSINVPNEVRNAILQSDKNFKVVYTTTEEGDAFQRLVYAKRLDNQQSIILTTSIQVIEDSVFIANKFYIYTGILILLLASIIMYKFSKNFTLPIVKMSEVSKKMAELDFDETITIKSKDELAELAANINRLSSILKKSIKRMNQDIIYEKTLSRNLSHELKTPIAVIKGYTEGILYSVADSPEEKEKYLTTIIEEFDKMTELVKEMLEFSKLATYDNVSTEFPIFYSQEICDNINSRFGQMFKEKQIEFSCKNEKVKIKGNLSLLNHGVENLISNAIKYGQGSIGLFIYRKETHNIIEVFNSGENIPESEIENIFAPFYKMDQSHNRMVDGHGLGLSIVNSIAEIHNGKAYCKNLENGVSFFIEILL